MSQSEDVPDAKSSDPFAVLLTLAAKGDQDAQQRLCSHYEPQVRIVARILLGPLLRPHLDTVDVLQSVHRSLLVGLRNQKFEISSPDKLVALACTIVRRKVARKWRIHKRQYRMDSLSHTNFDVVQALDRIATESNGPENAAAYNDSYEKLYGSLNEVEQQMLVMRLEGFTTGEIAAALNMHAVATRVRWLRLRTRLTNLGVTADWL